MREGPDRAAEPVPRLHVVTDDRVLAWPELPRVAERILDAAGAAIALHLRGHGTDGRTLHALAARLMPSAARNGCPLVLNDRVDVALAVGGHRVHLGPRSLPIAVARRLLGPAAEIGASTHDASAAARAVAEGARWIFAGTIWATPSHRKARPQGLAGLVASVAAAGDTPVLAIGGVTPDRLASTRAVGAWGGAVIRGVWDAADPVAAVSEYLEALERARCAGEASTP